MINAHSVNEIYARAFPGVEVIATGATRDYMARTIHSMRYLLRKGANAADQRAALRIEEEFVAEFEQLQLVLPNVTFDGRPC